MFAIFEDNDLSERKLGLQDSDLIELYEKSDEAKETYKNVSSIPVLNLQLQMDGPVYFGNLFERLMINVEKGKDFEPPRSVDKCCS